MPLVLRYLIFVDFGGTALGVRAPVSCEFYNRTDMASDTCWVWVYGPEYSARV